MSILRRRPARGGASNRDASRRAASHRTSGSSPVSFFNRNRSVTPDFGTPLTLPPDPTLALATILLMAIGMVSVYSASPSSLALESSQSGYLLMHQFGAAILGGLVMIAASRLTLAQLDRATPWVSAVAMISLIVVLIPGIGQKVGGATRWIRLGPLSFQPSELARLATVLYAARFAARNPDAIKNWKGLLSAFGVPLVFCILILLQPDFDTGFIMLGFAGIIFFAAGLPWLYLGFGAVAGSAAAIALIWIEPYRMQRITGFLHPLEDPQGKGYQIIQCWTGMGSGGWFGRGLGKSVQKLGFLPEAHTDFIFAVIGEEGGFLVTALIVILFIILAWRGYRIAMAQSLSYARYLAVGITSMVTVQALINLAVVSGLMPTTGVPLPLVSYGGTSVVFITAALGILWGLSRRRNA